MYHARSVLSNKAIETEQTECFYGVIRRIQKHWNLWVYLARGVLLSNKPFGTEMVLLYGVNGNSKNSEFDGRT